MVSVDGAFGESHAVATSFAIDESGGKPMFDFIYVDQEHDAEAVAGDLRLWWPLLKPGGILGYRNYTGRGTPLDKAVDDFIRRERVSAEPLSGEIVLGK